MNPAPKRMTLREVARRAGVSTPTISKVLNGRPDVAPATRERVLRILHEEQYLPRGASALPSARQHVELVFDALSNPNNLEMMRGIISAARDTAVMSRSARFPRTSTHVPGSTSWSGLVVPV